MKIIRDVNRTLLPPEGSLQQDGDNFDKLVRKARLGLWKMNLEYKRTLGQFVGWF